MIRRFLTRLLLVMLIAFCAYNGWEVRQLQRQVQELQGRVAVRSQPDETLDWNTAQQRLTALQAQISRLRNRADSLWQRAHPPGRSPKP